MTTAKSYKDVLQLKIEISTFLITEGFLNVDKYTDKPQPKLVLSMKSVLKQVNKVLDTYNDLVDNFRINRCLEDPITKAVLKDEKGNYRFDKNGILELKKDVASLQLEMVEIHQRFTPVTSDDFKKWNLSEYEMFEEIFYPKQNEADEN